MPTAYSPGLQRLSELPGFTLVQGPCVVPGGLAVVGRPSCASTTELDAIMTMAKAANFVCGFTPAPLSLAISLRLSAKLSRPMLTKQIIQAYFDTSFCLRLCKSGRFIESPRWVSKPEKLTMSTCFPPCPRERTSRSKNAMSETCAKERHRLDHDPSATVAGIVNWNR